MQPSLHMARPRPFLLPLALALVGAVTLAAPGAPQQASGEGRPAERLRPEHLGRGVVEGADIVLEREAARRANPRADPKQRNGARGEWQVPKGRHAVRPHSGTKYVFNRWGDRRMGIGFGREVHLVGAWLARHGTRGLETSAVSVVGYRAGVAVGQSEWFTLQGDEPAWFAIELGSVDRVEFVARASHAGAGWFAMDDLTYEWQSASGPRVREVVDFESLDFRQRLTGSGHAGLTWELGTGDFRVGQGEPAPSHDAADPRPGNSERGNQPDGQVQGSGTIPQGLRRHDGIEGPAFGDAGTLGVPDTNGAVGPDHYVAAPNGNLSIYSRATGALLSSVAQTSFFGAGGTLGDPRVAYDSHADRFVLIASDWTERLFLAYSLTSDPTGAWFKTTIFTPVGPDAGTWPDYPTLGLDANGIYIGVFQVFQSMTIYAIDKAPLLAPTPSLGTVSAWRQLPIEGAIQPCVTFGDSGGVYLVSETSGRDWRLRQITGPLSAPTLNERGLVDIPPYASAPDVPQAGSGISLSAGSTRPMNAVYRDGMVWTVHTVAFEGRASVRWYRIDPSDASAAEIGTIADASRGYFMPSLAVNRFGSLVVGFSGSGPGQFAGAYATGRRSSDPPGSTGPVLELRAGDAPYTFSGAGGVSRWGDYSITGIDPVDDRTFWTIQEYAGTSNLWRTFVGALRFPRAQVPAGGPRDGGTLGE